MLGGNSHRQMKWIYVDVVEAVGENEGSVRGRVTMSPGTKQSERTDAHKEAHTPHIP